MGVLFGKGEKGGGYGQNFPLLPPLLCSHEQRGREGRRVKYEGALALEEGREAGKRGVKRGERGDFVPVLTSSGDGLWMEIDGGRWGTSGSTPGGGAVAQGKEGRWLGRLGGFGVVARRDLFIAGEGRCNQQMRPNAALCLTARAARPGQRPVRAVTL